MITTSDFKPAWYLRNPHLQTLAANLIKPAEPEVFYETVTLDDGDQLSLAHGTASGKHRVLILHGLEGSLRSAYARRILHYLNQRGMPATIMFFRGCDGNNNQVWFRYDATCDGTVTIDTVGSDYDTWLSVRD